MSGLKNFFEWPTHEEAPLLPTSKKKTPEKPLRIPQAMARDVFMAQSVDHGLSFMMCISWLALVFTLFHGLSGPTFVVGLGASFWWGLLGLMFINGFMLRIFSAYLLGASPGARLMGLELYTPAQENKALLKAYLWEAGEGALPGLWIFSTLLRLSDRPIGVSYIKRAL